MVAADAGVEEVPLRRADRGQGQHRGPVGLPAVDRAGLDAAVQAPVGDLQPVVELGVEVVGAGEGPSGHEAGLQVAVGPLDQALRFWITGPAQVHSDGEQARERGELGGQLALADAGLVVPDQYLGHRPPLGQQLPVPGDQVSGLPGGQHPGGDHPRVAADHDQHRRAGDLAVADRDVHRWEPQVALRQLAGQVGRAAGGVRRQVGGPQLAHPFLENGYPALPADPLGDHRGRHRRRGLEELTNLRLEGVDRRALRRPFVDRCPVGRNRPLDRVLRDAQMTGDRPDRHLLGPMEPTDLSPVLHGYHPLLLTLNTKIRMIGRPQVGQICTAE